MSWTAPRTWVAGEVLTAALMNTHVRDDLKALTDWTTPSFSAGLFTSSSGTWVVAGGNVGYNRYVYAGHKLDWHVFLSGSTITGAPQFLKLTVPIGAFSSANSIQKAAIVNDSGVIRDGNVQVFDGTHLAVARADGGNFTAGVTFGVAFQALFEMA